MKNFIIVVFTLIIIGLWIAPPVLVHVFNNNDWAGLYFFAAVGTFFYGIFIYEKWHDL